MTTQFTLKTRAMRSISYQRDNTPPPRILTFGRITTEFGAFPKMGHTKISGMKKSLESHHLLMEAKLVFIRDGTFSRASFVNLKISHNQQGIFKTVLGQ